jgi:hypothetical protein
VDETAWRDCTDPDALLRFTLDLPALSRDAAAEMLRTVLGNLADGLRPSSVITWVGECAGAAPGDRTRACKHPPLALHSGDP